jgi:hypothetical protein
VATVAGGVGLALVDGDAGLSGGGAPPPLVCSCVAAACNATAAAGELDDSSWEEDAAMPWLSSSLLNATLNASSNATGLLG